MQDDSKVVASTYNKPLITSEWLVEVFHVAKTRGRGKDYIWNEHGRPEALEDLRPWLNLFEIDLKSSSEKEYHYEKDAPVAWQGL